MNHFLTCVSGRRLFNVVLLLAVVERPRPNHNLCLLSESPNESSPRFYRLTPCSRQRSGRQFGVHFCMILVVVEQLVVDDILLWCFSLELVARVGRKFRGVSAENAECRGPLGRPVERLRSLR